ncbi:phosphate signaling complex protein PhoU [Prochlorothrix hollandica]|uniref:Phosphate-specific transport system accessory protein PhoU n=1 Tax=Prochlorothrix hollandica PCC 9006 = CALU 1027 TaxID=317619 RepID=A0A0M2PXT2_PROHO|nr:phosphate signaling complex protein PhoU [Prochlorothrix hollandica]KKJ00980.1 PhoU family transcriptional regulator [Prochlorothrix hollandica PCC 9006 = CALU 1027]
MSSSSSSRGTRSHFDRQLQAVQQDVLRMGALVESSCWLAEQALLDRDLDAAKAVCDQDQAVDQLYRQIEADCLSIIALQSPVSQDLRLLSSIMHLIRDLERIGDHASDIGELALQLFPHPPHSSMHRIRLMLTRCRAMLAMSLEALANLDAKTGQSLQAKDDWVDSDYEDLYQVLVNQPLQGSPVEQIVLLVLVIRYLERMADHCTNIGNRVVFIVTGERKT